VDQLIAILVWHSDVGNDNVRLEFIEVCNRLPHGLRRPDGRAKLAQYNVQKIPGVFFVVDDEHADVLQFIFIGCRLAHGITGRRWLWEELNLRTRFPVHQSSVRNPRAKQSITAADRVLRWVEQIDCKRVIERWHSPLQFRIVWVPLQLEIIIVMQAIRGNVLVVDDNEDVGGLCVMILSKSGYGVRWAQTREAALLSMNTYIYDVIIIDHSMPGMPLEEFLQKTRAVRKVVLMSAIVDLSIEAARLGLAHFIKKPFDPQALKSIVE
jgi:CheY-like chemotaxis protein